MENKKILIVEDTRIIALSIKSDLEDLGYTVVEIIDNGLEAVAMATTVDVDLILMDINIKGDMDGIETSQLILAQKDVPIVYLTAYTDFATIERAKTTSPYGYIIKPYEEKTLEITISFALYKHQQEKQFRTIFNATHDGIVISDLKGTLLKTNISSHNFLTIPEGCTNIKEALKNINKNVDIETYIGKLILLKNDSIEILNETTLNTLEIKGREIEYNGQPAFIHIIRDISESKEIHRKIVAASLETEERDKQHFAEELHDGVGPLISTVKTYLNTLQDVDDEKSKHEILDRIFIIIDEIVINIKEISNDLRPHLLRNFGYNSATSTFIKKIEDAWPSVQFKFNSEIKERFKENIEVTFYRITTELINNTLKHAHANKIEISLRKEKEQYVYEYNDNGNGVDLKLAKQNSTGMGLLNIENRVNSIPGTLSVNSNPGKGFKVRVTVPLSIVNK